MNARASMGATDTVRNHETPEGIRLELKLAGPVVRACAWAIDMLIRGVMYALIAGVFSYFGGIGTAVILISFFLIEWFYPVIFEVLSGATPGKKAMGLVVIHDNGTPISFVSSVIRNLLRAADFLPLLYAVGLLSMLLSRDFQRLGDLAAGTLVVYREQAQERGKLPEAPSKPPPRELDVDELRELIMFAERSPKLTQERQVELASQLRSVTQKEGAAGVKEIFSYANWLTRGR
ncbi:MAG: RDD family protein [Chromatiales bacterium]|nr:RDD family protein [Chromatiales bacterium]